MPIAVKSSFKRIVRLSDGCPIWFVLQVNICGLLEVLACVVRSAVYLFRQQLQIIDIANLIRVFRCAFSVKAFSCQIRRKICRLRAACVFQYRQAVVCEFPCGIIAENCGELRRKCSACIGKVCAVYPSCVFSRNGCVIYLCAVPSVISC